MAGFGDTNNSNVLALIALIISVTAMIIGTMQLLAQWFSTDGLRQCSKASIGSWSVFRKRKWRSAGWSFEITYVVPYIFLGSLEQIKEFQEQSQPVHNEYPSCFYLDIYKNAPETQGRVRQLLGVSSNDSDEDGSDDGGNANCLTAPHHCTRTEEKARQKSSQKQRSRHTIGPQSKLDGWLAFIQTLQADWLLHKTPQISNSQIVTTEVWPKLLNLCRPRDKNVPSSRAVHTSTLPGEQPNMDEIILGIKLERFSWDTMHPDISRPMAYTTVADLGAIVRGMGMIWRKFDPYSERGMFAEGRGYLVDGSVVRGLGLLVHFQKTQTTRPAVEEKSKRSEPLQNDNDWESDPEKHPLYNGQKRNLRLNGMNSRKKTGDQRISLRRPEIFSLLYGIWPGDPVLRLNDLNISTWDHCINIIESVYRQNRIWLREGKCGGAIQSSREHAAERRGRINSYELGFITVLHMIAPMLREKGSMEMSVPLLGDAGSPPYNRNHREAFCKAVKKFIDSTTLNHLGQLRLIEESMERDIWEVDRFGPRGEEKDAKVQREARLIRHYDDIQELHNSATAYLQTSGVRIWKLVESHIRLALENSLDRKDYGRPHDASYNEFEQHTMMRRIMEDAQSFQIAKIYLHGYSGGMREEEGKKVVTAWATLMFRAFCFEAIHDLNKYEGPFLPQKYIDSKMRVYLA